MPGVPQNPHNSKRRGNTNLMFLCQNHATTSAVVNMIQIDRLRVALLGLTLVGYVATFSGAAIVGLGIDYASLLPTLLLMLVSFLALNAYTWWRGMPRLRAVSETLFGGVALAIPVLLATYLAMRANMPLADTTLMALDSYLPFDWHAFIAFVDNHPFLASALWLSYQSFATQLLLMPMLLCLLGRETRAYQFVIAYALIGFVAAVIAIWYPAMSAYSAYGIDPSSLKNINTHFSYAFLREFDGVRTDPSFVFGMDKAAGIVTFPSVHTAVAILCIWGAWTTKWLRYPMFVLNLLMAASTVSHGSHYFVDVLAAVPLAFICIYLAALVPTFSMPIGYPIRAMNPSSTRGRAD